MWRSISCDVLQSMDSAESPPSSPMSGSSFRVIDLEFLKKQAKIWIEQILEIRFNDDEYLVDLLADGQILFRIARKITVLLQTRFGLSIESLKFPQATAFRNSGKYLPYSYLDAFLKVCQILGLTGVDLFSPSDVVEKKNIRKVCMCIRALSKKARSKQLEVPDFDEVTDSLFMPTDMVENIRNYLEKTRYASGDSGYSHFPTKEMSRQENGAFFVSSYEFFREDSGYAKSGLNFPDGCHDSVLETNDGSSSCNSTSPRSPHSTEEGYWSSRSSTLEDPQGSSLCELIVHSNSNYESNSKDSTIADIMGSDFYKHASRSYYTHQSHNMFKQPTMTPKSLDSSLLSCDKCNTDVTMNDCLDNDRKPRKSVAFTVGNIVIPPSWSKANLVTADCYEGPQRHTMISANLTDSTQPCKCCMYNISPNKDAALKVPSKLSVNNVKASWTNMPMVNTFDIEKYKNGTDTNSIQWEGNPGVNDCITKVTSRDMHDRNMVGKSIRVANESETHSHSISSGEWEIQCDNMHKNQGETDGLVSYSGDNACKNLENFDSANSLSKDINNTDDLKAIAEDAEKSNKTISGGNENEDFEVQVRKNSGAVSNRKKNLWAPFMFTGLTIVGSILWFMQAENKMKRKPMQFGAAGGSATSEASNKFHGPSPKDLVRKNAEVKKPVKMYFYPGDRINLR